ncbi:MAG: biopolymer transporter ExbD [Pseudomonadota bacterium]
MKQTRRTKRMQRNHERASKHPGFNMISLMDIFTILVFFLLVNSSEVQVSNNKAIQLPESVAQQKPRETVTIMVTANEILVQNRKVMTTETAQATEGGVLAELKAELDVLAGLRRYRNPAEEELGREITISGDKEIPFRLLKKIMTTCTAADFSRISLSVVQKAVES